MEKMGLCSPACVGTLEALRQAYPQDEAVWTTLRGVYLERKDWAGVLRLEEGRTASRSPAEARDLAAVQINTGRFTDAAAVLEPMVAAQPRNAELARLLGHALFSLGDYDRAAPLLDTAMAGLPPGEAAEAATSRGLIHFYRGKPREAEEVLRKATTLAPDHLPAYNALGRLLASRGAERESQAMFKRAREIQAAATALEQRRLLLGSLSGMVNPAFAQGRYPEAESLLLRMIEEADPRQKPQLFRFLAQVRKAAGRGAEAEAALREAERLDGKGTR